MPKFLLVRVILYLLEHLEKDIKTPQNEVLKLVNKSTNIPRDFTLFRQQDLCNNKAIQFDITKLELEYDYDTDIEQIAKCKEMLENELRETVDFFLKDDPLKLVENLDGRY